jgi:hypothetical protein
MYSSATTILLSTSIPIEIIKERIVMELRLRPKLGMIPKVARSEAGREMATIRPILPCMKNIKTPITTNRPEIALEVRVSSFAFTLTPSSLKITNWALPLYFSSYSKFNHLACEPVEIIKLSAK